MILGSTLKYLLGLPRIRQQSINRLHYDSDSDQATYWTSRAATLLALHGKKRQERLLRHLNTPHSFHPFFTLSLFLK
jgi:hypothetical protein